MGELGNNTKDNTSSYIKLETIEDVIYSSCGNTYTIIVKKDGTVWGMGDYAHGDESIKSKTKGIIPIQVGNDETGFKETEIVVEVDSSKNITANTSYEFNLIYLNENFAENLEFSSLKQEIAGVSSEGIIRGLRIGTTRVNAISSTNQKTYSILVKVIEKGGITAPKVYAGENSTSVLKADRKYMDIWI